MTFWFDIFNFHSKVFHFQIVVLWTQWTKEKTSREWWRASTSLSNSCCPLWRMARWMTRILLRLRRRWRGTSPGASKPWQPERKDCWESLHRSWLLKVCPPSSFSPLSSPGWLYTKREGNDGCTRRGEQGHQSTKEDTESRLIRVWDWYQSSWTCVEGVMIILPSCPHRSLSSPCSRFLPLLLLPVTTVSLSTLWTHLWMQGATRMAMPQALVGRMKLDLSSSFFELIQVLGKGISPQFISSKWPQMINNVSF